MVYFRMTENRRIRSEEAEVPPRRREVPCRD